MALCVAIGYDGSEQARVAVRTAADLFQGASALIVHIYDTAVSAPAVAGVPAVGVPLNPPPHEVLEPIEAEAREVADEGVALGRRCGLDAESAISDARGRTHETLTEVARSQGADVVVVGSRGRGALKAAMLGSVSTGLVHTSELPVLVVPASSRS